jgi:hypothetical protein
VTQVEQLHSLSKVGDLLRVRLDEINSAFFEREYPEFQKKLSAVKERVRILTLQAEWELNKGLYR